MTTTIEQPPQEKRIVGFKLSEATIEAVHVEARKRRCWPNRVIEDLVRKGLIEARNPELTPAQSA